MPDVSSFTRAMASLRPIILRTAGGAVRFLAVQRKGRSVAFAARVSAGRSARYSSDRQAIENEGPSCVFTQFREHSMIFWQMRKFAEERTFRFLATALADHEAPDKQGSDS